MSDIKRMLMSLGWTDRNASLLPDDLNLPPDPIQLQPSALWKAAVSQKHAEIIEERACHLPPNVNSGVAHISSSSFVPNKVRIVNKTYLFKSFIFF